MALDGLFQENLQDIPDGKISTIGVSEVDVGNADTGVRCSAFLQVIDDN